MATTDDTDGQPTQKVLGVENPLLKRLNSLTDLYRSVRVSWLLVRDPRVTLTRKAIPAAVLLYVLLPVDLLPAIVTGVFGLVDDLVVLAVGLDLFIRSVPPEIVNEHLRALGYEPVPVLPEESREPNA